MTLRRRVMSNDGTLSYPDAQENNQLRCMVLLHDAAALHIASRTRVHTVVVLGNRKGYSSAVATGCLKPVPVWVKSTNLLLDCVEEKYFTGTNGLRLTV